MKVPPVAIGAGAGLAAVLLLAPATGQALGELAAARTEHAQLRAEAAAPAVSGEMLPAGLALSVADAAAGRAAMMARVQALAKSGGVLVEEIRAVSMPGRLAGLTIRVSGAEKAVLAFADALERGRPLVRLRSWRVEPVAGGGVRLTGEAVSAWR